MNPIQKILTYAGIGAVVLASSISAEAQEITKRIFAQQTNRLFLNTHSFDGVYSDFNLSAGLTFNYKDFTINADAMLMSSLTDQTIEHRIEDGADIFVKFLYAEYNLNNFKIKGGAFPNNFGMLKEPSIPFNGLGVEYTKGKFEAELVHHMGQYMIDESDSKMIGGEIRFKTGKLNLFANFMRWYDLDSTKTFTNSITDEGNFKEKFGIIHSGIKTNFKKYNIDLIVGYNILADNDNFGFVITASYNKDKWTGKIQYRHFQQDYDFSPYAMKYTPRTNTNQILFLNVIQINDNLSINTVTAFGKRMNDDFGNKLNASFFENIVFFQQLALEYTIK